MAVFIIGGYSWKEYVQEIVYIKRIHNTVIDAISWLEYNPMVNLTNEYNFAMHGVPMEEPCFHIANNIGTLTWNVT
jgi:hypothetical protein